MTKKIISKFEEYGIEPQKVGNKNLALVNLNGEYAIKVNSLCYALLTKTEDSNKTRDEDYPDYFVCGYHNSLNDLFKKLIHEKTLTKTGKYDMINIEKYIAIYEESVLEIYKLCKKIDNLNFKEIE